MLYGKLVGDNHSKSIDSDTSLPTYVNDHKDPTAPNGDIDDVTDDNDEELKVEEEK